MAYLKRIELRNVLSFEHVEVELEPLTVLIGANNAGKSNFFRALGFVDAIFRKMSLGEWQENPLENSLYRDAKDARAQIDLTVGDFDDSSEFASFQYCIKFDPTGSHVKITHEELVGERSDGTRESIIYTNDQGIRQFEGGGKEDNEYAPPLLVQRRKHPAISCFARAVHPVSTYKLEPREMRGSSRIKANAILDPSGSNLAAAIDRILDDPNLGAELQRMLIQSIPEIEKIRLYSPHDTYKAIQIFERPFGRAFETEEFSDGLLLFLGMLVLVFQPSGPRIICLEEPDQGIHPRRLIDILEFLDDIVYRRNTGRDAQILISTHSPYLLDHFKDRLHEVRLVERKEGKSHILKMSERVQQMGGEFDQSLGELWFSGAVGGVPNDQSRVSR